MIVFIDKNATNYYALQTGDKVHKELNVAGNFEKKVCGVNIARLYRVNTMSTHGH